MPGKANEIAGFSDLRASAAAGFLPARELIEYKSTFFLI